VPPPSRGRVVIDAAAVRHVQALASDKGLESRSLALPGAGVVRFTLPEGRSTRAQPPDEEEIRILEPPSTRRQAELCHIRPSHVKIGRRRAAA
jgi:hypothetical protein